jgi:hypothetical protein
MTGMVKEEILTRWASWGDVAAGRLVFNAALLRQSEFLTPATAFEYVDVSGATLTLALPAGALAYTFCQVPIVTWRMGRRGWTSTLPTAISSRSPGWRWTRRSAGTSSGAMARSCG